MENRVGYNNIRDGQGASMHQICPDCIGLVLEEMFVQQQDCIEVHGQGVHASIATRSFQLWRLSGCLWSPNADRTQRLIPRILPSWSTWDKKHI